MEIVYHQPCYKSPFTPHELIVASREPDSVWVSCIHTHVANDQQRRGWVQDDETREWFPPQAYYLAAGLFPTREEAISRARII